MIRAVSSTAQEGQWHAAFVGAVGSDNSDCLDRAERRGVSMSTKWHIKGDQLASCNCDWGCPCQFNARPTHGHCQAVIGFQVREGHFGDIQLDGLKVAGMYSLPGAPHEGDGTMQLVIDERATEEQRNALISITTAEHGGLPWEIFSAICPHKREPVTSAIAFDMDRERRVGTIRVPGLAEVDVEPIKNPVTGEEHRARIVLPEGFEYNEAEMGNTTSLKVTSKEPLLYEHDNCYAQLVDFDWTNAN